MVTDQLLEELEIPSAPLVRAPKESNSSVLLSRILEPPSYGFVRGGTLYVPTRRELFREFFFRLNFLRTQKNWLPAWSWFATTSLTIPFFVFLFGYFSWPLLLLGLVYSMVVLGSHATLYLHRYGTHRAYRFSHPIWRFFVRNLVIKIIPEEIYIVSHHVHHKYTEQPGDPYNVHGGWLYCFLADVNHQLIARDMSEKDYLQVAKMIEPTGVRVNTYAQYKKWGSASHPLRTIIHYVLNWGFWFAVFYSVGGPSLVTAIFGFSAIWGFGVRTFNFDGHGRGSDRRREGVDFNGADLSVNQVWPGYVAGEWHNNHHLYPNGARSGFLPSQLDLPWLFIRFYSAIGGISSYRDYKADFLRDHYEPYLLRKAAPADSTI